MALDRPLVENTFIFIDAVIPTIRGILIALEPSSLGNCSLPIVEMQMSLCSYFTSRIATRFKI